MHSRLASPWQRAGGTKLAATAREDFVSRYERDYPSATACFLDDFEACIARTCDCRWRIGA